MTIVNLCLVVMLGIINMQYSHAQLLTDLNNNKLIKDFLNYFPNATVERNLENVLDTTNINYLFPATGLLVNFTTQDQLLDQSSNTLEITGKSFIGGTIAITIRSRGTVARSSVPNNRTITGRISSIGVSERLAINAINVIANVSLASTGYTLDNMRILFVPVDDDLPYTINASERALGDSIKNWLTNNVPVVVDKYKAYVDQLTSAGVLILNDSLL